MSRAIHSYFWVRNVCRPLVKTLNITLMYFLSLYSSIPRKIFASEHVLDPGIDTDLRLRKRGFRTHVQGDPFVFLGSKCV